MTALKSLTNFVIYGMILCLAVTALDYQDRCLYYSDQDGLCCSGGEDKIQAQVDIEGKGHRSYNFWPGTICESFATFTCSSKIAPAMITSIFADEISPTHYRTYIPLKQEVKRITDTFNRLKQLIVRVTVDINSAQKTFIDEQPYRCVVIGDNQVHHYSSNSLLTLKCDKFHGEQLLSE